MHIIFNPSVNEENKYIEIMVRPLKEKGFTVHALDDFLSNRKHFVSIKLVHLNWFENVDDSSFLKALKSFFRKMIVLLFIRFSRKKLVWTMHNRMSHEKNLSFFSRTITDFLIRWSDKIIIHSEISKAILMSKYPKVENKLYYLPHPDFIGIYGPVPDINQEIATSAPLALLFIGAIKPYKNIELLIRAVGIFKDSVRLTIAGNPNSTAYRQKILNLAEQAGNITLRLEFISDHEIPQLIQQSDLLVLPYDLESSLNSGTVLLAFSYKKTVICPEIGTIRDLGPIKDKVFHYQYHTAEEHLTHLTENIDKALQLKSDHPDIFKLQGNQVYEYVKKFHSKKLTGEKLINLYQSLLE